MIRAACVATWIAMVAFLGTSFSVRGDDLPDLGEAARAELSPQMERKIGERIMNEIRLREPSYIDDAELNDYLNALGRRLVAASASPARRRCPNSSRPPAISSSGDRGGRRRLAAIFFRRNIGGAIGPGAGGLP